MSIREILGIVMVVSSLADGWKYRLQTSKVRHSKSAKNCSRLFIIIAIAVDIIKTSYGISARDWYIVSTGVIALYFMCEYLQALYTYYDYKTYPRRVFRVISHPTFIDFLINSLLPNNKRKHL